MGKSLVIVESPAKAKTLKKFLGKDYFIKSSVGHLIDLPAKAFGVDIEKDFEPSYVTIKGKGKILQELIDAASMADNIYLAPDPDREGEAIAWHISNHLKGKQKGKIFRVLFNEITKKSVKEAINKPREIDTNKVQAQQTRRILDRLVGYKISPILWKKVRRGLSAGRVQSVAVRLIYEREEEIKAFIQEEYWKIKADFKGNVLPDFETLLFNISGKKERISNVADASKILEDLKDSTYLVDNIQKKERKKNPVPPFITSTLQQEAYRKLNFSSKKTMMLAQKLYEGLDVGEDGPVGLITYMRTDSTRVADEAITDVRKNIVRLYGEEYIPSKPNIYKSKKNIQDAHEAIRPTSMERKPDKIEKYLSKDENRLYALIWKRFVASQMEKAILDTTSIDIKAKKYIFRATGSVIKFLGFMKVYQESKDIKGEQENDKKYLPDIKEGEKVELLKIEKTQHFTQPPARYSEASLIKELEEKGIGRPSTYSTIMSTIRGRDYVVSEDRKFKPTELGVLITELLIESFPKVLNFEFTAAMEDQLDDIEVGKKGWIKTLKEFYNPFETNLKSAESNMRNVKVEIEPTDEICDKCQGNMGIRWGKYGKFLACMNYPTCKNSKPLNENEKDGMEIDKGIETDEICEKCDCIMLIKNSRFGKFLACSKYPECKFTKSISTGVNCPECNGYIGERYSKKGKVFFGCSNYPKCNFALWNRPIPEKCPSCDSPFLIEKWNKKGKIVQCKEKECSYKREEE